MPVIIGVLAAVLIGASDFLGARSAGRSTALQSTTAAFGGGVVAVLAISPFLGEPTVRDLLIGAASGVMLAIGLTTLWRAYANSTIGVAGSVAAVVSTVVPVLFDAARGQVPGWLGWLGVVVGLTALVLTSWQTGGESGARREGIVLGVLGGVFLGLMYVIAVTSSDASGTWPILSQRVAALALALGVATARRQRPLAARDPAIGSAWAGAVGAAGVAAVVYGGQRYPLAPVVVGSSTYPAWAVAMAWIWLDQQLSRRQIVGLFGALVGVTLIALD